MAHNFHNRFEAGRQLAQRLADYGDRDDVLVLALPRGGVPVAYEVAQALHVPMDLVLVRKLGLPGQEELAMGAIATGGTRVLNQEVLQQVAVPPQTLEQVTQREHQELNRRQRLYRGDQPDPQVQGRIVIVIDDGLATGSTMLAAVQALRQQAPARIVAAVPVAPPETCDMLSEYVDELVCLLQPSSFGGVGRWYDDFDQTSDQEVRDLLQHAAQQQHGPARP
jgi:putative phosphoribosyl transferase